MFVFFFFFQAEDGIRDLYVTGVKTCALPISRRPSPIKHRWPQARQRTRPPSGVQSEPTIVWRSSRAASASWARRNFVRSGRDAAGTTSPPKPALGLTGFMVWIGNRRQNSPAHTLLS